MRATIVTDSSSLLTAALAVTSLALVNSGEFFFSVIPSNNFFCLVFICNSNRNQRSVMGVLTFFNQMTINPIISLPPCSVMTDIKTKFQAKSKQQNTRQKTLQVLLILPTFSI